MGKLQVRSVNQIIGTSWPRYLQALPTYTVILSALKKEDTYLSIFSIGQQKQFDKFKACKNINILFKSKRALNLNMGRYLGPRNIVVVYELNEK